MSWVRRQWARARMIWKATMIGMGTATSAVEHGASTHDAHRLGVRKAEQALRDAEREDT